MKKLFAVILLLSQHAFAQNFAIADRNFNDEHPSISDEQPKVYIMKNGNYHRGYINNVPSGIMTDFIQKYDGAEDISWVLNDKRVDGYFRFRDQDIVVTYKNGYLETTRKTYEASQVSSNIRRFLQSDKAKGFDISKVIEIITDKNVLYEVMMLKENQHCVARLFKNSLGELELMEKIYFTEPDMTKL